MAITTESIGFPFAINESGSTARISNRSEYIRGKIIQILFTAPGERVNQPEFGCGLLNLVFEPNDAVLATAVEYSIGQSLTRWLADDISVDGVNADKVDGNILIEVAYTIKKDLSRSAVRISFK